MVAEITMKGDILKDIHDLGRYQLNDEAIKMLKEKFPKNLEFLEENGVTYVKNKISNEWKFLLPRTLVKPQ